MTAHLIVQSHLSQTIFVDIQSKLIGAMSQENITIFTKNCTTLAQASRLLQVPSLISEQYPKGLGQTVPEILSVLPDIKPIEKITFSCLNTPAFKAKLICDRPQIILAGMEAHICILQTALGLLQAGKQVFVVEDAIISRNPSLKANALVRMRDAGCIISNTESVMFEWLGRADADGFKTLSQLIR